MLQLEVYLLGHVRRRIFCLIELLGVLVTTSQLIRYFGIGFV
jgi:hypothetical protein